MVRVGKLSSITVGIVVLGGACSALIACNGDDARAQDKSRAVADSSVASRARERVPLVPPNDDSPRSLARAAGINPYVVDDTLVPHAEGTISGEITAPATLPRDTVVIPKVDLNECRPFEETTIPHRGRGVGQAVVWLVGVTHGPRDTTSRRIMLRMEKCRLSPRVQRSPVGGTVNIGTRNAMMSKLQVTDVGDSAITARTVISLNDEGQVVPSSDALARPGLIQVQDANHPWALAFIAVAPHPFVATTLPDGKFSFEHVPPGAYVLVAWHERLGARSTPVVITAGGTVKATIAF